MKKIICLMTLWGVLASNAYAARSFNGTSDYMQCGSNLVTSPQLSISFWLNQDSFGSGDKLLLEESTNWNNFSGILVDTGGTASPCSSGFYFGASYISLQSRYRIRRFAQPSSGVWHHYLLTMSNADDSNWQAFVDGTSQTLSNCNSNSPDSGTAANIVGGNNLYLMSRAGSSLFNGGKLAELAIWSAVLTANEAKSLATGTQPWNIRAEKLNYPYAPIWGVDSPEPSYSGQHSSCTVHGTTQANHPPMHP